MKQKEQKKFLIKIGFFSIILIFLDQLTKFFFTSKIYFLNSFIYFSYSKNYGSAFNIFSNINIYNFIIIIFSILILIFLIFNIKKFIKNKFYFYGFIFLISGIFGNLLDRIFFGYVKDFISIKYLFIFNLADFYLSITFILFVLYEFNFKKLKNK